MISSKVTGDIAGQADIYLVLYWSREELVTTRRNIAALHMMGLMKFNRPRIIQRHHGSDNSCIWMFPDRRSSSSTAHFQVQFYESSHVAQVRFQWEAEPHRSG
jgi:hypothetical protein